MCGIVGYVGDKAVDTLLIVSLERLEYRGYDSAGIATLNGGKLGIRKQVGKIQVLKEILKEEPLEGALKLKEISYIHAEGYAAGEMKHGPLALVDERMPVVCIAPKDSVYQKMISNIQEVKARKGKVIAIAT